MHSKKRTIRKPCFLHSKLKKKLRAMQPFHILNENQVFAFAQRMVRRASAITGWPRITSRQMLCHFKWDCARMLDQWFLHGSIEAASQLAFFAEAKVAAPLAKPLKADQNDNRIIAADPIAAWTMPLELCNICCNETSLIDLIGCSHRYCKECWTTYVTQQIRESNGPVVEADAVAMAIRCPDPQCGHALPDNWVAELLPADGDLLRMYQRAVCQSYVLCTVVLRWCPGASTASTTTKQPQQQVVAVDHVCRRAVRVLDVHTVDVTITCECGHMFCFNCGLPEHQPLPCFLQRLWLASHNRLVFWLDGPSAVWMKDFSKQCPECRIPIEKTMGCDHMICLFCGKKFNWSEVQNSDVLKWSISNEYNEARNRSVRFGGALVLGEKFEKANFDIDNLQSAWRTLRNVSILFYYVRDYELVELKKIYSDLDEFMQRIVAEDVTVSGGHIALLLRNLLSLIRTRIGQWNFKE